MKTMLVALAGASLLAAGCAKQEAAVSLRVGTWKTQQTLQPFAYAEHLPASYRCEVLPFTNPGDMKTALLAGSLDACGTTLVHAILSASKGEPVVLVCSLCNKCSALVVGAKTDIQAPADLKGRKIGYVPSTMHHLLLLEVLHRAGLKPDDVTLVRVDFFDMVTALSRGQIDAFLSGEPHPTLAVRQGAGRVLAYPYFDDSIGPLNAGMLVRRETIEKTPEKVRQLVLAHAAATRSFLADRDAWIRRAAQFGSPPDVLREAAGNIELAWDMDDAFVAQVRRLGDKMLDRGMIEKLPDWDRLMDTQFVAEVRAAAR
jgi:NitT/TauT family transport system substrate-binding protein